MKTVFHGSVVMQLLVIHLLKELYDCIPNYLKSSTSQINDKRLKIYYTAILRPTEVTEAEYESLAEETLDSLCEFFEDFPESNPCSDDYDCSYGVG